MTDQTDRQRAEAKARGLTNDFGFAHDKRYQLVVNTLTELILSARREGRIAGREEAAKKAEACYATHAEFAQAQYIAAAIRALPAPEDE